MKTGIIENGKKRQRKRERHRERQRGGVRDTECKNEDVCIDIYIGIQIERKR